jgi:hypothetical protein
MCLTLHGVACQIAAFSYRIGYAALPDMPPGTPVRTWAAMSGQLARRSQQARMPASSSRPSRRSGAGVPAVSASMGLDPTAAATAGTPFGRACAIGHAAASPRHGVRGGRLECDQRTSVSTLPSVRCNRPIRLVHTDQYYIFRIQCQGRFQQADDLGLGPREQSRHSAKRARACRDFMWSERRHPQVDRRSAAPAHGGARCKSMMPASQVAAKPRPRRGSDQERVTCAAREPGRRRWRSRPARS